VTGDTNLTLRNDVKAVTGFVLLEDRLAKLELLLGTDLRDPFEFGFVQVGKDGRLFQKA
jgi:hypothetical protein